MNIDNIHVVSKSLEKFINSLKEDKINISSPESLQWLNLLFLIIEASNRVVSLIDDSNPVLIHCSGKLFKKFQISQFFQRWMG